MIAKRRSGSSGGADLLVLLRGAKDENGEGISDEYAHHEVITMFVAGQET
jgi:cytochrome P450